MKETDMELTDGFLYGIIGGLMTEVLGLFRLRQQSSKDFPEWIKSWFYWLATSLMIIMGGILVVVYLKSGIEFKAIVAVNIGASAPLIIGSLVSQTPRAIKTD
jgi:hypothetical protein